MTLFSASSLNWRSMGLKVWFRAVELARREVKRKEPGRIMFCSMCDPYQPIERDLKLARRVLEALLNSRFLVLIMTKKQSGHQRL